MGIWAKGTASIDLNELQDHTRTSLVAVVSGAEAYLPPRTLPGRLLSRLSEAA